MSIMTMYLLAGVFAILLIGSTALIVQFLVGDVEEKERLNKRLKEFSIIVFLGLTIVISITYFIF